MSDKRMRRISVMLALILWSTWGCTTVRTTSSAALPSSAYFVADPSDLEALHTLARTQEARMRACHNPVACEQASYTRGLVALFENRADAINIFQELHITVPDGHYAAESLRWLYLLQERFTPSVHNTALQAQLRQAVLRALLDGTDVTVSRRGKH
ncbi:hypothetical protein [Nitrospira sp. Nam80]